MIFRAYLTLTELKMLQNNYNPDQNQNPYDRSQQDNNMRQFILDASRLFDEEVSREAVRKRTFAPVYETRYFNMEIVDYPNFSNTEDALVPPTNGPASEIYLKDDLLEVATLTTKNGGTTLSASDYWLLHRWGRRDRTPYDMVRMREASSQAWEYDTDPVRAFAVTGWWGYHEDWANAWVNSGDTLSANITTTTATTMTTTDVDGDDPYGVGYRIKEMQLAKIDDEIVFISKVNAETNVCTIVRGANGSTAATHTSGAAIYTFEPQREARSAVWTWALYLMNRKNSIGKTDGVTVSARGDLFIAGRMPPDVALYAENLKTARL